MELNIKLLYHLVRPLEVINLLGCHLHKADNGQYNTTCPKCEKKLYILDNEVVCENGECTFRAGSIFDFVVAKEKCKWDEVIPLIDKILGGKLNTSGLCGGNSLHYQLKAKRQLFDYFLRAGLGGTINKMQTTQYRSAIRAQGIDADALRWSVYITSKEETTTLVDLIKNINPSYNYDINGTNIILPYFSDYHTVSHIIVLDSPSGVPEKLPVIPHRISYFGLLQRHPVLGYTKLAFSYAEAAKLNTQYARMAPENVCLHVLFDAKSEGISFTPKIADYVVTNGRNDNIRAISILSRNIPTLNVDENKVGSAYNKRICTAEDYLVDVVVDNVKAGLPSKDILDIIDLSASGRQALLEKLHNHRLFEPASVIRDYFKTLPIYQDDKGTLSCTPTGYVLRKKNNDPSPTFVTNFTITLEQNVVFSETTDIYHAGNIVFNGNEYPIIIKQEETEKPNDIEKAARRATLGMEFDDINTLPTIKDRTGAKYIVAYMRECVAALPRTEGVPMLGWSARRTSFYAPHFISDIKGTRVGRKYFHPNVQVLNQYILDTLCVSRMYYGLPMQLVSIINQCAAFVARSYLGMPVRPIAVFNNTQARRMVCEIFKGLNQNSVVQLNQNIRGEEYVGNRGYPYYAVGYSYAQTTKSRIPAFILCDKGIAINEEFSNEHMDQAACTLNYVIQKVVEWAIQTSCANFKQEYSVSRATAYAAEGAAIITDACGVIDWPHNETPYQNIDAMLASIQFDDVRQYFTRDVNRHIVRITRPVNSALDMDGLHKELSYISKHVTPTDTYIDVDSESMVEALSTYYHTEPSIPEVFDAVELLGRKPV